MASLQSELDSQYLPMGWVKELGLSMSVFAVLTTSALSLRVEGALPSFVEPWASPGCQADLKDSCKDSNNIRILHRALGCFARICFFDFFCWCQKPLCKPENHEVWLTRTASADRWLLLVASTVFVTVGSLSCGQWVVDKQGTSF